MRGDFIIALVILDLLSCNYMNGKGSADKYAQNWITTNIPSTLHPTFDCMNRDTDDNGYVTCTVMYDGPESSREVVPIECGVDRVGTGCDIEGCKPLIPTRLPGAGRGR